MSKTEKDQIREEIDAIMQARPAPNHKVDLSPLTLGKSVSFEGFCFAQYRGFALYDSPIISLPIAWEKQEPPPLTIQVILSKRPDGCLQFDIRGKGLPCMDQQPFCQVGE